MTNFERFQARAAAHKAAQEKINTHFIFQGYPSIEIASGSQKVQAAVVNKQEKEEAFIYTQLDTPLNIGSVWQAKNLHLLITEEITIIKDVNWHKYHALLCNLDVEDLYGYFIGPEKSHLNLSLKKEVLLVSSQNPMLVLPGRPLDSQDKIMISGRAWMVDEYDAISTKGITYYSLMPTTMSKEVIFEHQGEEYFIEKHVEYSQVAVAEPTEAKYLTDDDDRSVLGIHADDDRLMISAGQEITLDTDAGTFKCNVKSVKLTKRTSSSVTFKVPFGVEEFAVEISRSGQPVTIKYKVV